MTQRTECFLTVTYAKLPWVCQHVCMCMMPNNTAFHAGWIRQPWTYQYPLHPLIWIELLVKKKHGNAYNFLIVYLVLAQCSPCVCFLSCPAYFWSMKESIFDWHTHYHVYHISYAMIDCPFCWTLTPCSQMLVLFIHVQASCLSQMCWLINIHISTSSTHPSFHCLSVARSRQYSCLNLTHLVEILKTSLLH